MYHRNFLLDHILETDSRLKHPIDAFCTVSNTTHRFQGVRHGSELVRPPRISSKPLLELAIILKEVFMNYRKGMLTALLAPVIALGSGALSQVHASGFALFTQGASPLGQGNAVTAHTVSPSTVFFNPALMNRLKGTQIEVGSTMIVAGRDFNSGTPGESASDTAVFFPSTFYATHAVNDKVSVGLGVFTPFGLGTDWGGDWTGHYIATKSEMQTFNINPAFSYQLTPELSLAVGLDVVIQDATLQKKISSLALGIPGAPFDINSKFKGEGTGFGFNVGAAYDIGKTITVGAHYRSEVKADASGDATFSAVIPNTQGKTDITLPQQVTAAIAYRPSEALTVEAGLRWEGWSSFDKLTVTLDNPLLGAQTTPRNWKDAWGMNLGGRYRLNDALALSAGYIYGNSPVPDSTFDPSIPDAPTHIFCLGSDLNYRQFKIALAYAYQLYLDRTKNNDVDASLPSPPFGKANGKYQTDGHLMALSVGYQF
jgi:long-chain fatty acid transport protein